MEGGDANAVVARAQSVGLTHLYVHTGSTKRGLINMDFVDALLPIAHANGLKVLGWDFPKLDDVQVDIDRAVQAINHQAPDGSRLDGYVPDIETGSEGTNLTVEGVTTYSAILRRVVGPNYPLIACVPNPSAHFQGFYPYAEMAPYYDALAPMVYWLNREPDSDVAAALDWLSQFGKPMLPIGQAYDGVAEGGRTGPDRRRDRPVHQHRCRPRGAGRGVLVVAARAGGGVGHDPADAVLCTTAAPSPAAAPAASAAARAHPANAPIAVGRFRHGAG